MPLFLILTLLPGQLPLAELLTGILLVAFVSVIVLRFGLDLPRRELVAELASAPLPLQTELFLTGV